MNNIKNNIVNSKNIFIFIFFLTILSSLLFLYNVIYPFILAFIISYILSPLTLILNKYTPKVFASFLSILCFVLILVLVTSLIVPILFSQFEKLIIMAPIYAEKLKQLSTSFLDEYNLKEEINSEQIFNFTKIIITNFGNTGNELIGGGIKFFNSIFDFLMVFVLTFYMLLELDNIKEFFLKLAHTSNLNFFSKILDEINKNLSRYLRGQGLICLLLAIYYGFFLHLVSLEFGLVLGIFVGLIAFVPYIGSFLGLMIALLLGASQFGVSPSLLIILFIFLIGQVLESYYLTPKLIGEAIKLNPLWIIFSLSCGAKFFGVLGILIAIPFAAIIGVLVRFWFTLVFEKNN